VLEKNTCRGSDRVLAPHFSAELRQRKTESQRENRVARSEQTIEGNALADYRGERNKELRQPTSRRRRRRSGLICRSAEKRRYPRQLPAGLRTSTPFAMCLFVALQTLSTLQNFSSRAVRLSRGENNFALPILDDYSIIQSEAADSALHLVY